MSSVIEDSTLKNGFFQKIRNLTSGFNKIPRKKSSGNKKNDEQKSEEFFNNKPIENLNTQEISQSQFITNTDFENDSTLKTSYGNYIGFLLNEGNHKALDLSTMSISNTETDKTIQNEPLLQSCSEIAQIFLSILRQGMLGALTFLLLMSTFIIVIIFAGHLRPSELFVSVLGVGGAYFSCCSSFIWGFNISFNVVASRCFALKQHQLLNRYFKRQLRLIWNLSVIFVIYSVILFYSFN